MITPLVIACIVIATVASFAAWYVDKHRAD